MKKDNILVRIKNSIYSVNDMAIYCKQGIGKAILYALVLCSIIGAVKGIILGINVNSVFNKSIIELQKDEYEFEIKDGILDIKKSPIEIEQNSLLFYVDDDITLDNVEDLKSKTVNEDQYILILKDGVSVSSIGMNYTMTYNQIIQNESINNSYVIDMIKVTKIFTIVFAIILNILSVFIYYLLDAVIIALFAFINVIIFKETINYSELFSLVIYTATLPNILVLILSLISPSTYFGTVALIGTLLYTFIVQRHMRISENES